jgi:hypothetical protein
MKLFGKTFEELMKMDDEALMEFRRLILDKRDEKGTTRTEKLHIDNTLTEINRIFFVRRNCR